MTNDLKTLLEKAKSAQMTAEESEQQRQSFAFGNTNIENPRITKETIRKEAEAIKSGDE